MKYALIILLGLTTMNFNSHTREHAASDNREIVEVFLNGFNDATKMQESLALLAEDYHFKNPMVELNSKAEFISLAREISAVLTGVEVIRLAESDDWIAAHYVFTSSIPAVESNVATEWFRIENGLIVESHLIYDASIWRRIYEEMQK